MNREKRRHVGQADVAGPDRQHVGEILEWIDAEGLRSVLNAFADAVPICVPCTVRFSTARQARHAGRARRDDHTFTDAVDVRAGLTLWADTTVVASCLASCSGSSSLTREQDQRVLAQKDGRSPWARRFVVRDGVRFFGHYTDDALAQLTQFLAHVM